MRRNVVIVGASKGLGRALALLMYKNSNLFLLSRKIKKLTFAKKEVVKIKCDVASKESIKRAFKKIDKLTFTIDVLINCAGIGLEKNLEDSQNTEIEKVIKTNLLGAIFVSKEAYKRMMVRKSGHIINISSTSGKKAREKETIYCASKWGLAGFTESLRLEAQKNNIKVTTVYPGGMKTDFYSKLPDKDISRFMDPKHVARQIICLINSQRLVCPSEITIERMEK